MISVRNKRPSVDVVMTGGGIILAFVCTFLPRDVSSILLIAGYPASNFLFAIAGIFACVLALRNRVHLPSYFWFLVAAFLYMAVLGVCRFRDDLFDWRFYVLDILYSSGFLVGVIWGNCIDSDGCERWVSRVFYIATFFLAITALAIRLGFVSALEQDGRVFDPAQFSSAFCVIFCLPLIHIRGRLPCSTARRIWRFCISAFAFGLVLYVGYISATRSIVMAATFGVVSSILVAFPWLRVFFAITSLVSMFFIQILLSLIDWGSLDSGLFGRFSQLGDMRSESRVQELLLLSEQMSVLDYVFGKGFGIGFLSPVAGEDLMGTVMNPHVAIFTPLQKGGVLVFVLFLIPLGFSFWKYVSFKSHQACSLWVVSILFFYVTASMSGGWYYVPCLLLGIAVSRLLLTSSGAVMSQYRMSKPSNNNE